MYVEDPDARAKRPRRKQRYRRRTQRKESESGAQTIEAISQLREDARGVEPDPKRQRLVPGDTQAIQHSSVELSAIAATGVRHDSSLSTGITSLQGIQSVAPGASVSVSSSTVPIAPAPNIAAQKPESQGLANVLQTKGLEASQQHLFRSHLLRNPPRGTVPSTPHRINTYLPPSHQPGALPRAAIGQQAASAVLSPPHTFVQYPYSELTRGAHSRAPGAFPSMFTAVDSASTLPYTKEFNEILNNVSRDVFVICFARVSALVIRKLHSSLPVS
jgi:hypothetical protein